ncbi:hypothetical protein DBZ36_05250 [Alginatibacterium sediminis]|uniref:Alpha/beta hydrolase n=1 Tax=Alginatibacterium sediminis TaxID=2164068 RepID=A0A420EH34_9ALTE|nr:hypothetical protein [Alginatibacterium sediminis]RKF19866.1 hypothetical protein DBZ36_05250 [Alginatibacterium sediminis]
MSDKPLVLVVHGMGRHSAESVKRSVIEACNYSLASYPSWRTKTAKKKIEDYVEIVGIGYDHIFEKERASIASNADALKSLLATLGSFPAEIINTLSKTDEDNFLTTHLLDVIFYAATHHEIVRLYIAKEITKHLQAAGTRKVHIVGHSLSTIVLNDTLGKLFGGGILDTDGTRYRLTGLLNQIQSLWMFANASEAMFKLNPTKTTINPLESLAKPSMNRSTATCKYYNVMHALDPMRLDGFEPRIGDNWIPNETYLRAYKYIQTEHLIETPNPHDLFGYIIDPAVRYRFLWEIMPADAISISKQERDQVENEVVDLVDQLRELSESFSSISSASNFSDWIQNLSQFGKTLEAMSGKTL